MNDLFRFLLLRPADVTASENIKILKATFFDNGITREEARRAAQGFIAKEALLLSADQLAFVSAARVVRSGVGLSSLLAKDISAMVVKETGKTAVEVVGDPRFAADEARLADSLVAMWLLSNSCGGDAPGLAELAQAYDAIRLAASGRDPVSLRVLCVDDFAGSGPKQQPTSRRDAPLSVDTRVEGISKPLQNIRNLEAAIATLRTVPVSVFDTTACSDASSSVARLDTRLAALEAPGDGPRKLSGEASPPTAITRPWVMSPQAISLLSPTVHSTLSSAGIDLHTQPLPMVIEALHAQRTEQLMVVQKASLPAEKMQFLVGNSFADISFDEYVDSPSAGLPTTPGSIRPVGVGDLLLVKQHVLRYEGGDLAHVENVLKSEHLSRDTRRLERMETTFVQETETTKEEQRDTQTTDRFSLKRETSDTIKSDASLKAGIAVDAKYGPFVEVKANADFATSTSSESSTKQASEFSKDVVARSVSKLVERVLERRSTTTITEFEEKYSHGFDNTAGAAHISGFYQWIDKVMQAQVYNYGKRLLFDVTVPEPGTNFILAQTSSKDQGQNLVKPEPFTLTADQINEGNYTFWAQKYEVTGLEPPPAPVKTVSKSYDATFSQEPRDVSKSDTLAIDDGYRAKYVHVQHAAFGWPSLLWGWKIVIGSNLFDGLGTVGYANMNGETGSVSVAYWAHELQDLAATIEIFCELTERGTAVWQLKMHGAITQGYQAKVKAYEQALAQALAAAGTVIAGRNPIFNAQLVASELRKQCLTLVTAQQFDAFGALELSSEGYAQPNLSATETQMPYVRFFEQAFEWEHIVYFFYPYFWGLKKAWNKHMLLDDTDPAFGDFLRAGAARVVFPVRPGFEAAVVHYLDTGEIWNGGPPPDISSSLYVPIIKEIQQTTGAPGNEVPVGDPWLVHLPTTLVRLRPNDDLPEWKKIGENWQPVN